MSVRYMYILAPVFGWDKKTFLFTGKGGLKIVGSKYCLTTTPASQIIDKS